MFVYGVRNGVEGAVRCQTWQEVEDVKDMLDEWTAVTDWFGVVIESADGGTPTDSPQ